MSLSHSTSFPRRSLFGAAAAVVTGGSVLAAPAAQASAASSTSSASSSTSSSASEAAQAAERPAHQLGCPLGKGV